jgi:hypothetical protein
VREILELLPRLEAKGKPRPPSLVLMTTSRLWSTRQLTQGTSLHRNAFQRREKAAEDFAIREREKEKLADLKRQIADQQSHLKKLSDHM